MRETSLTPGIALVWNIPEKHEGVERSAHLLLWLPLCQVPLYSVDRSGRSMPIHWNLLMARMMLDRGWMGQVREDADTGKMQGPRSRIGIDSKANQLVIGCRWNLRRGKSSDATMKDQIGWMK